MRRPQLSKDPRYGSINDRINHLGQGLDAQPARKVASEFSYAAVTLYRVFENLDNLIALIPLKYNAA